jgi:hypothetical protein
LARKVIEMINNHGNHEYLKGHPGRSLGSSLGGLGGSEYLPIQLAQQHWQQMQAEGELAQALNASHGSWRHRLAAWLYAIASRIDDWSSEQHNDLRDQAKQAKQTLRAGLAKRGQKTVF